MKTLGSIQRIIKQSQRQTPGEMLRKRRYLHDAINPMDANS